MNRADITVHARDGQIQLVVEIKNKQGATSEWASQLHRNLLVHSMIPFAPFFLLALPDTFHFWKSDGPLSLSAPPDFSMPADAVFAASSEDTSLLLDDISEQGLRMLVTGWLEELVRSSREAPLGAGEQWMVESGLLLAIQGGVVAVEALV